MFSVGITQSLATSNNNVDQTFREASTTTKEVTGGNGHLLDTEGFDSWVKSAKSNPGLIVDRSSLSPITDVIFDPVRKQHMSQAIIDYCNKADLHNSIAKFERMDAKAAGL